MVSPERAVVDMLYFRRDISSAADMLELRFDIEVFNALDSLKILELAYRFQKPWLTGKVKELLEVIANA